MSIIVPDLKPITERLDNHERRLKVVESLTVRELLVLLYRRIMRVKS